MSHAFSPAKACAQRFDGDPLKIRNTDHYTEEYIEAFVDKWDKLIDWEVRRKSEGGFFIDVLKKAGKKRILDVSTGTGFHSIQLLKAGFDVTSADGSGQMLAKAFDNGKREGLILKTVLIDWRQLSRSIQSRYDALICLGNSFTHLFDETDRHRVLAEFYSVINHDGILILDQRNYDAILDSGYSGKNQYYYCGDEVKVEPEYVDDSLARFRYLFSDGSVYYLNMFPLRKNYVRNLLLEAGFQDVGTYGDFKAKYQDASCEFYIHVAEKL